MIVTNAGGPGVLAADALIPMVVARRLSADYGRVDRILPAWATALIDVIGDARPDRYAAAVDIAARVKRWTPVIMTPQPDDCDDIAS
jgi:acetyltransferase